MAYRVESINRDGKWVVSSRDFPGDKLRAAEWKLGSLRERFPNKTYRLVTLEVGYVGTFSQPGAPQFFAKE